jgi:hypothetical protein
MSKPSAAGGGAKGFDLPSPKNTAAERICRRRVQNLYFVKKAYLSTYPSVPTDASPLPLFPLLFP